MKTNKVALAAGVFAGLAALPLTAASAATPAPSGFANAEALSVTVSLQPLKAVGNGLAYAELTSALSSLQDALCKSPAGCNPLGLTLPTSLPDSLTVNVAMAEDKATLNSAATDVVAGHADSTPIKTDWEVLNANIGALENELASLINTGATALASGNISALNSLLSLSNGGLSVSAPVLGTAKFDLLGTVSADLPGNGAPQPATAVQINGDPSSATKGLGVTVDPFTACAVNAAQFSACQGATGPQTSAANTLTKVTLPDLVGTANTTAGLTALASELQSLVSALTQAIANPSQAGSLLGSVPGVPAPVQSQLTALGGLLSGATSGAATTAAPVDLSALKAFDTQLSAALDSVNALIKALANFQGLPDLTNLITSTADIATAKTGPVAGGGVASVATSTLGAIDVLPMGSTLQGLINTAVAAVNTHGGGAAGLVPVTDPNFPLLRVEGVNATASASVGPNGAQSGTSGLHTVYVLGQPIKLDSLTGNSALPAGGEWNHVFTFPGLGANAGTGSITLDITRGVPQVVADTPQYREVHMAALDVRLINGAVGCSSTASSCTDPLAATNAANSPRTATSGPTGVAALGTDGDMVNLGAPVAVAAAGFVPEGTTSSPCTVNCTTPLSDTKHQTSLPETGMFGGGALPLGLGLIAVAISLRLVPSLRLRLRRVR